MLATVIVTHNSQQVLPRCLDALHKQTVPVDFVVLVDSGSSDVSYLEHHEKNDGIRVIKTGNIGFSVANNLGAKQIPSSCEFVLFLNPDTFLHPECLARAVETMRRDTGAGIMSGKLFRFDVAADKTTSVIDSTGIFRTWYGRWHDRGQGDEDKGKYEQQEADIPAACGALMFCRKKALDDAALAENVYFDPDFFLYKEDIELCLRIRKKGWRVVYQPLCIAWHGRGWKKRRREIPKDIRVMAARNEVVLYAKHPSPYIGWATAKYFLVRTLNI